MNAAITCTTFADLPVRLKPHFCPVRLLFPCLSAAFPPFLHFCSFYPSIFFPVVPQFLLPSLFLALSLSLSFHTPSALIRLCQSAREVCERSLQRFLRPYLSFRIHSCRCSLASKSVEPAVLYRLLILAQSRCLLATPPWLQLTTCKPHRRLRRSEITPRAPVLLDFAFPLARIDTCRR